MRSTRASLGACLLVALLAAPAGAQPKAPGSGPASAPASKGIKPAPKMFECVFPGGFKLRLKAVDAESARRQCHIKAPRRPGQAVPPAESLQVTEAMTALQTG